MKGKCLKIYLFLAIAIGISACFSPWQGDKAVLNINFGGSGRAAAWPPDEAVQAALEHRIRLEGPTGVQNHTLETGKSSAHFILVPGRWTVSIESYLYEELYAAGSNSIQLTAGNNSLVIQMNYAGREDGNFPVYDCEIDISSFFGNNIIGTYSTPASPSSVMLLAGTSATFAVETSFPLSSGTINIAKSNLPPNTIVYLKVSVVVGEVTHESKTVSVHTGKAIQVHDFMSVDSVLSSTTTAATVSANNGVWQIDFAAGNSYSGYGRILLSDVLDNNSKSISDIKAVYYKQKSIEDITQMVTYVREDVNASYFNLNSVKGAGTEDTWTDVLVPSAEQALRDGTDFSGLNNANANRRISIGVSNSTAATLYIKDMYLIFDD